MLISQGRIKATRHGERVLLIDPNSLEEVRDLPKGRPKLFSSNWKAPDPRKKSARTQLTRAVIAGVVLRLPCAVCAHPNAEAHHEDYDRPLEVVWLCRKHHMERHRTKAQ